MKSQRLNIPEDDVTISRRHTRSINGGGNSFEIPFDLIIEILSRLPAKSIARCRCVSKLWASILRRTDFTEIFFTRSSSFPRLLFAFHTDGELFFFSTPQPQNLQENSSPSLIASYHMKIPYDTYSLQRITTMRGLVFLGDTKTLKRRKQLVSVVCNPATGESLTLPKLKTRRSLCLTSYFGYDPIEKQHKVLSMTSTILRGRQHAVSEEHQVLTLEAAKPSWRMVECSVPHFQGYGGICIDGVFYYPASVNKSSGISMIVCFDVRTEHFRYVEYRGGTLINYNGKLGAIRTHGHGLIFKIFTGYKLCILEDVEKGEWSEHIYVLSDSCVKLLDNSFSDIVGVTQSNELVLSRHCSLAGQTEPFYIYYYNLNRDTVVKIGIQGMEAFRGKRVYTFMDYVENVRSIT